jgi:hypothetical protein
MSLTYASFSTQLANFLVIPVGDPNLTAALPSIIDFAEQQAYKDLDLLNTVFRDTSVSFTAGNRNYTETTTVSGNGPFLVTQELNVITPAGQTNPELGTRNALLPATKEMLDFLYPNSTGSGVPVYFAPINQNTFIVGPWPDQAYTVEAVGTVRPAPLSVTNTTTLLSTYFPDLFLNAALIYGAGFLKDFGAATDDPKSGLTWAALYDKGLKSAVTEEARKRFQAQGWGAFSTPPDVTPPRT